VSQVYGGISPGIFMTVQDANFFDDKITKLNLLNHIDKEKIEVTSLTLSALYP